MSLDEGVVNLVHFPRFESPLEATVGDFALGDRHDARGPHIEAMHDALTLRRTGGGDAIASSGQRPQDRRPIPAGRRVGRETRRFIHENDIVIVIQNGHRVDHDRDDGGSLLRFERDFQENTGSNPLRFCPGSPIEECITAIDDALGEGPRKTEESTEDDIEPLPRQSFRDRNCPGFRHYAHPRGWSDKLL
jgi:hypothetical protein